MRRPSAPALAVAAAALLAFAGTLGFEFVWDDTLLIERSVLLREWRSLPTLLTSQLWAEAQEQSHYYRPLVALSFFADAQVWGRSPTGFHVTNVALHLATALAVLALARRLTGDALAAALAAGLFAVHPVHSESVAFVSGRSDVLATLGCVLAVTGYARWRSAGGQPALWASLGAFALALAAKEVAVVLPALLVALDWARDDRRPAALSPLARARGLATRYMPWLVVLGLYLGARAAVLGRIADTDGAAWAPLGIRLLTAADIASWYLRVALVPYPPHPYPLVAVVPWPPPAAAWAALALLAAGIGATVALARSSRVLGFGALWFWLALGPALAVNLLPTSTTVMGERFLYLPSVGLCLVGGLLLARAAAPRSAPGGEASYRPLGALAVAVVALAAIGLTLWRNEDWRDNYRLYLRMVETSPHADLPRVNLAFTQLPMGEVAAARANLEQATRLAPGNARAWAGLALTEALLGAHDRSGEHAARARRLAPSSAGVLATVGAAHLVRGDPVAAVGALETSLRLSPHQPHAALNLAVALSRAGRQPEAEATLERAIRLAATTSPGLPLVPAVAAEVLGRRDPALAAGVWRERIERLRGQGDLSPAQQAELAQAERQLARLEGTGR